MFPVRPDASDDGHDVRDEAGDVEGGGDAVAGDEEPEEEVEEAKAVRVARNPLAPTQAEREAHEATHLPFRSWCAECVAGRRDNPPHARMPEEEHQVPEVMLDYAFVRRGEETETTTILIAKDRDSRAIRAWVMRHKGVCLEEAGERAADAATAHRCVRRAVRTGEAV